MNKIGCGENNQAQISVQLGLNRFLQIFSNNDKMYKFSQSIEGKQKDEYRKYNLLRSFDFKIQNPRNQKQQTSVNAFKELSEKSIKINKSHEKTDRGDSELSQYISYKLSPPIQFSQNKKQKINKKQPTKEKDQFQSYDHNQQNITNTNITHSPKFFQFSQENSIKSTNDQIFSLVSTEKNYPFYKNYQNLPQQKQKNQHLNQNKYNEKFDEQYSYSKSTQLNLKPKQQDKKHPKSKLTDSVVTDNFDDYQIFTPCKNLQQEFLRQEKLYQHEKYNRIPKQFDSFSNKKQLIPNQNFFDQMQMKKINKNKENNKNIENNKIQKSNSKQGFFFLTNPIWTTQKKAKNEFLRQNQKYQPYKDENHQKRNDVKQFFFSLSSINVPNENEGKIACNNIFSNSLQNQLLFGSKEQSQTGFLFSRKYHVKQLVQQFIDQLQHIDENSLNCKAVNDLEGVLESIVFKQSKAVDQNLSKYTKYQNNEKQYYFNKITDYNLTQRQNILSSENKWKKSRSQIEYNNILTQRKPFVNKNRYQQSEKNPYMMKTISSQNRLIDKTNEEKGVSLQKSICRKDDSQKISLRDSKGFYQLYRPNIKLRQVIQQKQNKAPCNAFTQLKINKNSISPVNINPRSSIYVKKQKSMPIKNRIKTETSFHKKERIY